jgi:hypothetical protein
MENDIEQAVLLKIKLSNLTEGNSKDRNDIFSLEQELEHSIEADALGELDGDDFGEGFCTVYIYGMDADALFELIKPILRNFNFIKGSYIIKRYGSPGAREEHFLT